VASVSVNTVLDPENIEDSGLHTFLDPASVELKLEN
jgi:hypothetical protein